MFFLFKEFFLCWIRNFVLIQLIRQEKQFKIKLPVGFELKIYRSHWRIQVGCEPTPPLGPISWSFLAKILPNNRFLPQTQAGKSWICHWIMSPHHPVADLRGAPKTPPPRGGPNSFNFMQFWGNFGKIVCWRPPPRGNPGSATVIASARLLKI